MNNKRQLKRRHLIYYLRVFDRDKDKLIGHLADINQKGCMLISTKKIEINKEFNMKMLLPNPIMGSEELIFSTHSKWSKKDINPDFYLTGFEFDDFPSQKVKIIDKLIDDFGFND
ncbi:MAG: PilZ domain-containing protein [Candidatus Cloacimonadota bacterium]|nr:PilZ domain-containing protein [Candidatus Cloacimonadota bacterium]